MRIQKHRAIAKLWEDLKAEAHSAGTPEEANVLVRRPGYLEELSARAFADLRPSVAALDADELSQMTAMQTLDPEQREQLITDLAWVLVDFKQLALEHYAKGTLDQTQPFIAWQDGRPQARVIVRGALDR